MSSRRFINDPSRLVEGNLHSLTLIHPGIGLDENNKILYVRPKYPVPEHQRVSLISGGGSGHEPSFGAMVGPGLLSAAVVGSLFASPNAQQVCTAITSRVDHNGLGQSITSANEDGGALVIVMNYTGDVLNFGVGVEMARASGHNVEMIVVGDDVSVGRSRGGKVGRRGIAGTVLAHKISGALASLGYGLSQVAAAARLVADNMATVGATLEQVDIPGVNAKTVGVVGDVARSKKAVEVGMGIHNERGWSREVLEFDDLIEKMLKQLLATDDPERSFVDFVSEPQQPVVLLVNNLGGLSILELGAITSAILIRLEKKHSLVPIRVLSGTYMTSIDAKGFSITLLRAIDLGLSDTNILELLNSPCEAPGWPSSFHGHEMPKSLDLGSREEIRPHTAGAQSSGLTVDPDQMSRLLEAGLHNIIKCEPEITQFDKLVGDGDCGTTLKRGAEALLNHMRTTSLTGDIVIDVEALTRIVEGTMDGTSGAIYALFLNALISALRSAGPGFATASVWANALSESAAVLGNYTPARVGDRTLIDALVPFIETLKSTASLEKASVASLEAAAATKGMRASLGRSVYIGGSDCERVPDPGAWGLAQFFLGLASMF